MSNKTVLYTSGAEYPCLSVLGDSAHYYGVKSWLERVGVILPDHPHFELPDLLQLSPDPAEKDRLHVKNINRQKLSELH